MSLIDVLLEYLSATRPFGTTWFISMVFQLRHTLLLVFILLFVNNNALIMSLHVNELLGLYNICAYRESKVIVLPLLEIVCQFGVMPARGVVIGEV